MIPERKSTFIIYDFELQRTLLLSELEEIHQNPPDGHSVHFPGEPGAQGEIWTDIVRPGLKAASLVLAFVDLPNANVGFEIGYALGVEPATRVALAAYQREIPEWVKVPPLNGFICERLDDNNKIAEAVVAGDGVSVEGKPRAGSRLLVLCPGYATATNAFWKELRRTSDDLKTLSKDGWSLYDLPSELQDVGAVLWAVLPAPSDEKRDGKDNASLSIVAGFADGCGIPVKIAMHAQARVPLDVAARATTFASAKELAGLLRELLDGLKKVESDSRKPVERVVPRPEVGRLPQFEVPRELFLQRFVGRERLLSDYEDALRGLDARWKGTPVLGGGLVQAIWYSGFGGMGKSSLLRMAMLRTEELVSAKFALIDWDHVQWRKPLALPPDDLETMLKPVAYRLAQLYGVDELDDYWAADARVTAAAGDRAMRYQQFVDDLNRIGHAETNDSGQSSAVATARGAAAPGHSADREGLSSERLSSERPTAALRSALTQLQLWGKPLSVIEQQFFVEPEMQETAFRQWVEASGMPLADKEAALRPNEVRIGGLQACIRAVSVKQPLVMAFDTCELLSTRLDQWLRRLLAPICDGTTPVLILIASRLAPDIADPDRKSDTWRADVGDIRWRRVDFTEDVRFTVDEIAQALQRSRVPVPDLLDTARRLHRVTMGVPLAVGGLLDLNDRGEKILEDLESLDGDDQSTHTRPEEHVVQLVADRLLLHLAKRPDREQDFTDIAALTVLNSPDEPVLRRFWRVRSIAPRLKDLATRYSLIARGDLHGTVRTFLRRRFRMDDRPPVVDNVIQALSGIIEDMPIDGSPGEGGYMTGWARRLNLRAWREVAGVLEEFAPAIAVALAYNEHVQALVSLGAEVRCEQREANPLRGLIAGEEDYTWDRWSFAPQRRTGFRPWGSEQVFAWMQSVAARRKWAAHEIAALTLLLGLKRSAEGRHEESLVALTKAVDLTGIDRLPRRSEVATALADAGSALGASDQTWALAADAYGCAVRIDRQSVVYKSGLADLLLRQGKYAEARQWYEAAIEVAPTNGWAHDGLARAHYFENNFELAEQEFNRAIEFDPTEGAHYTNLSKLVRERGRATEAEALARHGLELSPSDSEAFEKLGLALADQQRHADALEAFERAIELNPTSATHSANYARALRDAKRYPEAAEAYGRALALDPLSAYAHNGLGRLHQEQKHYAEAEAAYRRAAEINSAEPAYLSNLGGALSELKRYAEAREAFDRALALDPQFAEAHNGLGRLDEKQGQHVEAEAAYKRAAELNPKEAIYATNWAHALRELKHFPQAEAALRQALALNPNSAYTFNEFGHLYEQLARYQDAEVAFRRAAEIAPTKSIYVANVARMLVQLRRFTEAEAEFRRSLSIDPQSAWLQNELGRFYDGQGQYAEAETAYRRAVELDATEAAYTSNLGRALNELKRHTEAKELFDRAIALEPQASYIYNELGRCYEDQGRYAEAEGAYGRAAELEPTNADYISRHGSMLIELGRYADAEDVLGRALIAVPDSAYTHNELGRVYFAQGRYREAEAAHRKASELDPDEAVYLVNLGSAQRELERYRDAQETLARALELDPKSAYVHSEIAHLYDRQGRYSDAAETYRRAAELAPTDTTYQSDLIAILYRLNEPEAAEKLLEECKTKVKEPLLLLNSVAWDLFQSSANLEVAERLAKEVVSAEPTNAAFLHTLASITLRQAGWPAASDAVVRLLNTSDLEFFSSYRDDVVALFGTIATAGRLEELKAAVLRVTEPERQRMLTELIQLATAPAA